MIDEATQKVDSRNFEIKSIKRAAEILECFSVQQPELSISEIASMLNLPKGTVSRYLSTLKSVGFVEQDTNSFVYRLGIRLFQLGKVVESQMDLKKIAAPHLKELAEKSGETVFLAIIRGSNVIYVHKERSNRAMSMSYNEGETCPMHCTALGKVILAFLPEERSKQIIQDMKLERFTENTITDPIKLEEEIRQIRSQGYAIDDQELEEGLRCVSAPIFDDRGVIIASISIAGPATRLRLKDMPIFIKMVTETAKRISQRLGYTG
jgi:DNA-binding IclR family transcriptional regulator